MADERQIDIAPLLDAELERYPTETGIRLLTENRDTLLSRLQDLLSDRLLIAAETGEAADEEALLREVVSDGVYTTVHCVSIQSDFCGDAIRALAIFNLSARQYAQDLVKCVPADLVLAESPDEAKHLNQIDAILAFFPETMINSVRHVGMRRSGGDAVPYNITVQPFIAQRTSTGAVLQICIADNGPGFSDEALAKVGKKRFTTKPADGDWPSEMPIGGSGNHLFNMSRLAETMGWKLICRNMGTIENARGAAVILEIPLVKSAYN